MADIRITGYTGNSRILELPTTINGENVIEVSGFDETEIKKITGTTILTIREKAFTNCSNLLEVSFPKCTSIGSSAFKSCANLTSISLPNCSVIESSAFMDCSKLNNISVPKLTSIGNAAFLDTVIEAFNFGSCSYIGYAAFSYGSLKSVYISNPTGYSYITIGTGAFNKCFQLSTISINASVSGNLQYVFCSCKKLTQVSIPYVSVIQEAFQSCTALEEIELPAVQRIGYSAFRDCTSLYSVNAPSCYSIDHYAFANCGSLYSINCPSCNYIGSHAFEGTQIDANFSLVKTIDEFAFANQPWLITVALPSTLLTIGATAFYNTSINSFSIESGGIFSYDTSNKLLYSGSCLALVLSFSSNMTIDSAFTSWNTYLFYGNSIIETIDAQITSLPIRTFGSCTKLKSVSLPECTSIGWAAFGSCSVLNSVSLNKCKYIGSWAFANCTNLSVLSLPAATHLDYYALSEMSKLESLYLMGSTVCSASVSSWGETFLYRTPMLNSSYLGHFGSIYVPASLLSSYQSANAWATVSERFVGV